MATNLRKELRTSCIFGAAVIGIFLGGGIVWAVRAPLSGAVIANGVIGFESKRQTIQHLEGGIIKEIRVTEGDIVTAGSTLLVLDDTAARARTEELRNRIRTLAAEEARLLAERARNAKIDFNHPLLQPADDAEVALVIEQQTSLFEARITNFNTRRNILKKRIGQLEKQIEGLEIQLKGVRTQLALVREEAETVAGLVDKGYERKPRLLSLLRAEADVSSTEGELITSIARGEEAISETEIRITNLETDLLENVDARLSQVTAERVSAEKLYRETTDRLSRTVVVSPIDGVVLDVRFKTVGGVVRASEPILDIVPVGDDELIINARIRPTDIDEVATGSAATVMFSAFQRRYLKRINGEVVQVSADAFSDENTRERFYLVDVKIDRAHLQEIAPELELTAGMPADVFITTKQRTVAEYLIQPVMRSFERAFREG
jgi:HlyD family type I secretion membrane fusion protein